MDKEIFKHKIQKVCSPLPGSKPESVTYTLTVKKKYEDLSIIDFYCKNVPRSNAAIWQQKISSRTLKVNGKVVSEEYVVKAGDLTSHTSEPKVEPPINPNIELIHACDDFWVINKPSPLPMHASGRFVRNTLINILELAFPEEEFKMVHRIDANTTGLVVIAKNREAANYLRIQFENKTVSKVYIVLVEGIVESDTIKTDTSIGKEVLEAGARKVTKEGRKANSEIEVMERRVNETLIKVMPQTGRTNQIRLHLADISHPIVGDLGYKDANYFKNNPFTYPDDSLFLHAYQIQFTHPNTDNKVMFQAPIPPKFKAE